MTMLSQSSILQYYNSGDIVISPFSNVELCFVDIHLGEHYWVITANPTMTPKENSVEYTVDGIKYNAVFHKAEKEITIPARGFILAHTQEFVGSRRPDIVCQIHTRSSFARMGFGVHTTAGLGDPGYTGRWTLEIWNHFDSPVSLKVGSRVGCVSFHRLEGRAVELYQGRYNNDEQTWTPFNMLPRHLSLCEKS